MMRPRRLELDYVARPRASRTLGVLVLLLGLATAGTLVERTRTVRVELARLETQRALLDTQRTMLRASSPRQLDEEARRVESVLRQLALPWGAIIESVEDASTGDVALLQLQPDAQQRALRLGAEARSQEAMLEYLQRLAAARGLGEVHVVTHQVRAEDPQHPVRFTVQASLRDLP